MARIYGALATGGTELGLRTETLRLLEEPGADPSGRRRDLVVQMNTRFSLGFVDPDAGVGYAYGMNRIGFYIRSTRASWPSELRSTR